MISKNTFIETIEAIQKEREFQDKLNDLLDVYCDDSTIVRFHMESAIVNLLEEIFHDEGEWVTYALYELDFLRAYKLGCVSDEDGTDIDISTWDKLYDFLIKNMEENK